MQQSEGHSTTSHSLQFIAAYSVGRVVTYTGSYLQQEIVAEGATRNIAAFSRFLKALAEERKLKRYLGVSLEARRRQVGEVTILPIHEFLRNLWDGAYA